MAEVEYSEDVPSIAKRAGWRFSAISDVTEDDEPIDSSK